MYRILLVDDEILVRDAIKENIDWAGLDCELTGICRNLRERPAGGGICKAAPGGYRADRYSYALYGRNGTEPFSP